MRPLLLAAALAMCVAPPHDVTVREEAGTYLVRARFTVPQPAAIARAVLTDYEEITRFLPDIKSSIVLERTPRLLVEQQVISAYAMFSKKVHLVLEITQDEESIHFVDRGGKSFKQYEGTWRLAEDAGGTAITYDLSAQPTFSLPGFMLKRLLKRDSTEMIDRLMAEMAARAQTR